MADDLGGRRWQIESRILEASNEAYLVRSIPDRADPRDSEEHSEASAGQTPIALAETKPTSETTAQAVAIYKPAGGERPLWDFPGAVLARHEVAAYEVSELLGLHVVPQSVWVTDAPQGPGSVQRWVDEDVSTDIDVFAEPEVPAGWLPVLRGMGEHDEPVVVAHRDSEVLADIALLDAVINNSDRKAGHVLGASGDRRYAIDHGVSFHPDDKLRTVLWGFAGRALFDAHTQSLAAFVKTLDPTMRAELAETAPATASLGEPALSALHERATRLLRDGAMPLPKPGWPVVPWPLW